MQAFLFWDLNLIKYKRNEDDYEVLKLWCRGVEPHHGAW